MIKLGDIDISKIYLGETEITKMYIGDTEIYGSSEPTPPTPSVPNTEIWVTTTNGMSPLYLPLCDWMRSLDVKRTPNEDGSWAVIRMFGDEFTMYFPNGNDGFNNLNGVEKIQFPNSITSFEFMTLMGSNPTLEFNLPNGCLTEDGNCGVNFDSLLDNGSTKIDVNVEMNFEEFAIKFIEQGTINFEYTHWMSGVEDDITFHFKDGDHPIMDLLIG